MMDRSLSSINNPRSEYVTRDELEKVWTEVRGTSKEMVEVKSELRNIRFAIDRMSANVERVVWVVVLAVVGAVLKLVLGV